MDRKGIERDKREAVVAYVVACHLEFCVVVVEMKSVVVVWSR